MTKSSNSGDTVPDSWAETVTLSWALHRRTCPTTSVTTRTCPCDLIHIGVCDFCRQIIYLLHGTKAPCAHETELIEWLEANGSQVL